jgi:hypothetical protein
MILFRTLLVGFLILGLASRADAAKKGKPENPDADNTASSDQGAVEGDSNSKPDESAVDTDKDRARFERALRKRFKKDDGYYVVRLVEVGQQEDAAQAQTAKDSNVAYKPYTSVTFEVLAGQDAAVTRLLDYLGEHNPPWQKKSTSKSKASEATSAPRPPQRDWRAVAWFPESEEGAQTAEAARTQAQQAYDAEIKAIEDRNTIKCRKCQQGG